VAAGLCLSLAGVSAWCSAVVPALKAQCGGVGASNTSELVLLGSALALYH